MSGQGRSTASPRSRHLSPRLTVSARSQSQRSAHTIYSDVESDHNVFAFIPPPAADAQVEDLDLPPAPALPPTEGDPLSTTSVRLPTSNLNRRRPDLPSFGQFARRLGTGFESSGPGTADSRVAIQEDGSMGGGSGSLPGSSGSDGGGEVTSRPRASGSGVFNFAVPVEDASPVTCLALVSDNPPPASSSKERSGSERLGEEESSIKYA